MTMVVLSAPRVEYACGRIWRPKSLKADSQLTRPMQRVMGYHVTI